jgi:hypothetical protein
MIFAAYQSQYLKVTLLASAKASASRHLASSTRSGFGSVASGSSGSTTPNLALKTKKKCSKGQSNNRRKANNSCRKGATRWSKTIVEEVRKR